MTDPQTIADLQGLLPDFRKNGYVILKDLLMSDEVIYFRQIYDRDRKEFGHPNCWHPFANQTRNCNALVTSPEFDQLLRHPKILPAIEFLMGGPVCFSEICLRHMTPYDGGETHQAFHRDRPHWEAHPLRMDYMQLMVYLTDVDERTHCFSISPESVDEPILEVAANVERNGTVDIHGPAGTVVLFNIAVPHTATFRASERERKTVQAYYGHRSRPYLSDCSVIPPRFSRHDPDPEVRAFYGNLNKTTRTYLAAFDSPSA